MQLENRIESALESPAPRAALARLMSALLELGHERDEIFAVLEAVRARLHAEGRAQEEDLILEAIDGFTGWCSPLPGE
jgi:hypothetical protein